LLNQPRRRYRRLGGAEPAGPLAGGDRDCLGSWLD